MRGKQGQGSGWGPAIAAILAGASALSCLVAIPLSYWLVDRSDIVTARGSDLVLGIAWPIAGAVVVRSAPGNRVGWVLVSASLIAPYHLAAYYAAAALEPSNGLPIFEPAAWLAVWGFVPYLFVPGLVLLLFPNGRALTPRWNIAVVTLVATASVTILARMFSPVTADLAPSVTNPWAIDWAGLKYVTLVGSVTCILGGVALGVTSLLLRVRRSAGRSRTQLQWLLLGGVALLVGFFTPMPNGLTEELASALGIAAPPVAIAIAIVRHGLFDVEFALNRTIVLVVLSGLVVAAYALVVLAIGSVGSSTGLGLLLVAVAALVAASGRTIVQAAVDRWLFGHRRDPYAVVSRVGRQIAPASEPHEALVLLVEALRRALRLPFVAFADVDGTTVAESGHPSVYWQAVPTIALGQQVGELRVGLRSSGYVFSAEERDAITEVAGRAATLAYARRLVADVAESRARIVVAREEERRRLRDDLHDELGPTLAGAAHQLESLASRLHAAGDDLGVERAEALRDRMRATVGDVRRIVHGLRPPVLDQLGLGAALASLLEGIDNPRCYSNVQLPRQLPAAVEVAAYAIAAEAVANSLRHSAGSGLWLTSSVTDDASTLHLEICDNGQGVNPRAVRGLGLRSMSERALEVGGIVEVGSGPDGGTRVTAQLPIGAP